MRERDRSESVSQSRPSSNTHPPPPRAFVPLPPGGEFGSIQLDAVDHQNPRLMWVSLPKLAWLSKEMPARPRARRGLGLGRPTGPHFGRDGLPACLPACLGGDASLPDRASIPSISRSGRRRAKMLSTTIFLHILCRVGLLGMRDPHTYMHAVNKRDIPSE